MAKVTIDEVEYDTDNMTDDQKNILNVLNKLNGVVRAHNTMC